MPPATLTLSNSLCAAPRAPRPSRGGEAWGWSLREQATRARGTCLIPCDGCSAATRAGRACRPGQSDRELAPGRGRGDLYTSFIPHRLSNL